MCERVCPEVFGVDAEGVLQYVDSALDVSLLPLLEQAEEGCPTGAITLHRDPG
jgi:ferredoxin